MPTFLYRIEPTRDDMPTAPTDAERELVAAHFAYLRSAYEAGTVRYVGRATERPWLGIALLEVADKSAADAFLAGDPAVAGGAFRGLTQAWNTVFEARG
jgi:uncharacterized protein YciI